jgi:hypothetical protein
MMKNARRLFFFMHLLSFNYGHDSGWPDFGFTQRGCKGLLHDLVWWKMTNVFPRHTNIADLLKNMDKMRLKCGRIMNFGLDNV